MKAINFQLDKSISTYSSCDEVFPHNGTLENALLEAWESGSQDIYTVFEARLESKSVDGVGMVQEIAKIQPKKFKQLRVSEDFDMNNFKAL